MSSATNKGQAKINKKIGTKKKISSPSLFSSKDRFFNHKGILLMLGIVIVGIIYVALSGAATPSTTAKLSKNGQIYGVTIENPENIDKIVTSLSNLSYKPTVRVVFQEEDTNPSYYAPYLQKLKPHAYIMGEILDSEAMQNLTKAQFQSRVDQYISTLNQYVDIWEVGNEINGSWLGDSNLRAENVGYAFDAVKKVGKPAAITTWYDPPACVDSDFEMISWNKKYIPQRVRDGVDYALLSYYGSSCTEYSKQVKNSPHNWDDFQHLNNSQWTTVFNQLKTVYPNSKLGFGEIGYQNDTAAFEGPGNKKMSDAEKVRLIKEYHGLDIKVDKYIGGYFYWEGSQDLVPYNNPIWKGFNEALDIQAGINGDASTSTSTPTPSPTPTTTVTPTPTPTTTVTPTPTPGNKPPIGPANISVSVVSSSQINLTWPAASDDSPGSLSYTVTRDGRQIYAGTKLSFSDTALTPATRYTYKVVAKDVGGLVSTGATISATTQASPTTQPPTVDTQPPSQPGPLRASLSFNGVKFSYDLTLSWAASMDNVGIKNYYIARNGVEYSPLSPTTTTFVDDKLQPGTAYTYQVWAVDNSGNLSIRTSASVQTACFWIFCWIY